MPVQINGVEVARWRRYHGYSQGQFAELIGLSPRASSYISEIETGKRFTTRTRVERMAKVLGVDVHTLLRGNHG